MAAEMSIRYFDSYGMKFSTYTTRSLRKAKQVGHDRGASAMITRDIGGERFFITGGASDRWYEYSRDRWMQWNCEASAPAMVEAANRFINQQVGEE